MPTDPYEQYAVKDTQDEPVASMAELRQLAMSSRSKSTSEPQAQAVAGQAVPVYGGNMPVDVWRDEQRGDWAHVAALTPFDTKLINAGALPHPESVDRYLNDTTASMYLNHIKRDSGAEDMDAIIGKYVPSRVANVTSRGMKPTNRERSEGYTQAGLPEALSALKTHEINPVNDNFLPEQDANDPAALEQAKAQGYEIPEYNIFIRDYNARLAKEKLKAEGGAGVRYRHSRSYLINQRAEKRAKEEYKDVAAWSLTAKAFPSGIAQGISDFVENAAINIPAAALEYAGFDDTEFSKQREALSTYREEDEAVKAKGRKLAGAEWAGTVEGIGNSIGQVAVTMGAGGALKLVSGGLNAAGKGKFIADVSSGIAGSGEYGMAASFGASQFAETYAGARYAGATPGEAAIVGLVTGGLEAGVTSTFSALGLGGLESTVTSRAMKQSLKAFLWSTAKDIAAELAEEQITSVSQSVFEAAFYDNLTKRFGQGLTEEQKKEFEDELTSGRHGKLAGVMKETFLQTIGTVGLVKGVKYGLDRYADNYQKKLERKAAVEGIPEPALEAVDTTGLKPSPKPKEEVKQPETETQEESVAQEQVPGIEEYSDEELAGLGAVKKYADAVEMENGRRERDAFDKLTPEEKRATLPDLAKSQQQIEGEMAYLSREIDTRMKAAEESEKSENERKAKLEDFNKRIKKLENNKGELEKRASKLTGLLTSDDKNEYAATGLKNTNAKLAETDKLIAQVTEKRKEFQAPTSPVVSFDAELDNLRNKLTELDGNKAAIEERIDSIVNDTPAQLKRIAEENIKAAAQARLDAERAQQAAQEAAAKLRAAQINRLKEENPELFEKLVVEAEETRRKAENAEDTAAMRQELAGKTAHEAKYGRVGRAKQELTEAQAVKKEALSKANELGVKVPPMPKIPGLSPDIWDEAVRLAGEGKQIGTTRAAQQGVKTAEDRARVQAEAAKAAQTPLQTGQPDATFKTSKGSTYTAYADGTTQRIKSLHVGHDPKDVGLKERSQKTYYISEEGMNRFAMFQGLSENEKGIEIKDGKAHSVYINSNGKLVTIESVDVSDSPSIGKYPLELWLRTETGSGKIVYRNWHPGNKITEMSSAGAATTATTPTPTAPGTAPTPLQTGQPAPAPADVPAIKAAVKNKKGKKANVAAAVVAKLPDEGQITKKNADEIIEAASKWEKDLAEDTPVIKATLAKHRDIAAATAQEFGLNFPNDLDSEWSSVSANDWFDPIRKANKNASKETMSKFKQALIKKFKNEVQPVSAPSEIGTGVMTEKDEKDIAEGLARLKAERQKLLTPKEETPLPGDSKPTFYYGEIKLIPQFASKLDKVAYIVAGKGKSKEHQKHIDWLKKNNYGDEAVMKRVMERGEEIRRYLKTQAEEGASGEVKVPVDPNDTPAFSGLPPITSKFVDSILDFVTSLTDIRFSDKLRKQLGGTDRTNLGIPDELTAREKRIALGASLQKETTWAQTLNKYRNYLVSPLRQHMSVTREKRFKLAAAYDHLLNKSMSVKGTIDRYAIPYIAMMRDKLTDGERYKMSRYLSLLDIISQWEKADANNKTPPVGRQAFEHETLDDARADAENMRQMLFEGNHTEDKAWNDRTEIRKLMYEESRQFMRNFKRALVDAGIMNKEILDNDAFFHREVIVYLDRQHGSGGNPSRKSLDPSKRKAEFKRLEDADLSDEQYDYSENLFEVELELVRSMSSKIAEVQWARKLAKLASPAALESRLRTKDMTDEQWQDQFVRVSLKQRDGDNYTPMFTPLSPHYVHPVGPIEEAIDAAVADGLNNAIMAKITTHEDADKAYRAMFPPMHNGDGVAYIHKDIHAALIEDQKSAARNAAIETGNDVSGGLAKMWLDFKSFGARVYLTNWVSLPGSIFIQAYGNAYNIALAGGFVGNKHQAHARDIFARVPEVRNRLKAFQDTGKLDAGLQSALTNGVLTLENIPAIGQALEGDAARFVKMTQDTPAQTTKKVVRAIFMPSPEAAMKILGGPDKIARLATYEHFLSLFTKNPMWLSDPNANANPAASYSDEVQSIALEHGPEAAARKMTNDMLGSTTDSAIATRMIDKWTGMFVRYFAFQPRFMYKTGRNAAMQIKQITKGGNGAYMAGANLVVVAAMTEGMKFVWNEFAKAAFRQLTGKEPQESAARSDGTIIWYQPDGTPIVKRGLMPHEDTLRFFGLDPNEFLKDMNDVRNGRMEYATAAANIMKRGVNVHAGMYLSPAIKGGFGLLSGYDIKEFTKPRQDDRLRLASQAVAPTKYYDRLAQLWGGDRVPPPMVIGSKNWIPSDPAEITAWMARMLGSNDDLRQDAYYQAMDMSRKWEKANIPKKKDEQDSFFRGQVAGMRDAVRYHDQGAFRVMRREYIAAHGPDSFNDFMYSLKRLNPLESLAGDAWDVNDNEGKFLTSLNKRDAEIVREATDYANDLSIAMWKEWTLAEEQDAKSPGYEEAVSKLVAARVREAARQPRLDMTREQIVDTVERGRKSVDWMKKREISNAQASRSFIREEARKGASTESMLRTLQRMPRL